ncbi:MAG: helix-turn-helix transcriptional regulator [Gemmatirosa sp.]|nr:helix-turn-helix transcriptional regulator [Gemmatirosa sp.]
MLEPNALVAVMDMRCTAPRSTTGPERLVPCHEMVFVRRGVFVTHVGRRHRIVADATNVLCMDGGLAVRYSHPTDDGDSYTAIGLSEGAVRELLARHTPRRAESAECALPAAHVMVTPAMTLRLHRLRATHADADAGRLGAEEAALALADDVLRAARAAHGPVREPRRAGTRRTRRELAEHVRLLLAGDVGAATSLADLAAATGASPFHLARTFQAEVGLPIHQYRIRLRLALALDRLAGGETSLSALGHDLGFSSHSHFTHAFRIAFGGAPSDVRRTLTARVHARLRSAVGIR